jgi:hypothetical protein
LSAKLPYHDLFQNVPPRAYRLAIDCGWETTITTFMILPTT